MARMGFRSFEEMIGRADRLRMREAIEHWKARGVDLSAILHRVEAPEEEIHHSRSRTTTSRSRWTTS